MTAMIACGNLFAPSPSAARTGEEWAEPLLARPGLTLERIVSTGQASPPGFWYDAPRDEWVVLLDGAAGLWIEGEAAPRTLATGDWVLLPAHCRHRVEWTDGERPSRWLALHVEPGPEER